LDACRSCDTHHPMHDLTALAIAGVEAKEEHNQSQESSCSQVTDELREALYGSTGLNGMRMLLSLVGDLHPVLRDGQLRKHA
jgi:hypothetical protein